MGDGWRGCNNLEGIKKVAWELHIGLHKHPLSSLRVESILERQGKLVDT